jgi:hypothetical protein
MLRDLRSCLGENVADDLLGTALLVRILNSQSRLLTTGKQVSSSIIVFAVEVIIIVITVIVLVG